MVCFLRKKLSNHYKKSKVLGNVELKIQTKLFYDSTSKHVNKTQIYEQLAYFV